jgi:hypothetical protein
VANVPQSSTIPLAQRATLRVGEYFGEEHQVEPDRGQRERDEEQERIELRHEAGSHSREVVGDLRRQPGHHGDIAEPHQAAEEGERDQAEPVERGGGAAAQARHALRPEDGERREKRQQRHVLLLSPTPRAPGT